MRAGQAIRLLGAALAIGCASQEPRHQQEAGEDPPPLPGTAAGSSSAEGRFLPRGFVRELVTIECDDRYMISGEFLRRQRTSGKLPGVILLHGIGHDRAAWYPLTMQVAARGFAVLAVDLRGHGESLMREKGWDGKSRELTEEEFLAMPQDIRNVVAHMAMIREVDGGRLAMAGMGLGADLAIIVSAQPWADAIRCVIAVSPGNSPHGAAALAAAREMSPGKTVYGVAPSDNEASLAAAKRIMAALDGPKEFVEVETAEDGSLRHGLLTKMPAWLMKCLQTGQRRPGAQAPRP